MRFMSRVLCNGQKWPHDFVVNFLNEAYFGKDLEGKFSSEFNVKFSFKYFDPSIIPSIKVVFKSIIESVNNFMRNLSPLFRYESVNNAFLYSSCLYFMP